MNGYFSYFVCSFQGAEICVGDLLLSRAVSSQVPSAAQVLTIVFGMGTGVSPARISTTNFLSPLMTEQQNNLYWFP